MSNLYFKLSFIFLMLSSYAFGQKASNKRGYTTRIEIIGEFQTTHLNLIENSISKNLNHYGLLEKCSTSPKFGILIETVKRNFVRTVFQFSALQITQFEGFNYVYCDPKLYGANEIENSKLIYKLQKFDFDIQYGYKISYKRISINPIIGISFSSGIRKYSDVIYRLDNNIDVRLERNRHSYNFLHRVNFGPNVNLNFSWNLSKRFQIFLAGDYKYFILKESLLNNNYNAYVSHLGIDFGLGFML